MPVHGIFTRKSVKAREMSGDHCLEALLAKPPTILISARGHDRLRKPQRVGGSGARHCRKAASPGVIWVSAVVNDLGIRGASTTTDLLHYFVDRQHLGEKEAESGEGRLL